MAEQQFEKSLTANDTDRSQSHQAGIHIPKGQRDLLAFLPPLDAGSLNPSAWLNAVDENGKVWRLRYIYYNNSLHNPGGTRDEFRITHLTSYLREAGAVPGDRLAISGQPGTGKIRVEIRKLETGSVQPKTVQLRGWRRVH